jgi:hypothetical protein
MPKIATIKANTANNSFICLLCFSSNADAHDSSSTNLPMICSSSNRLTETRECAPPWKGPHSQKVESAGCAAMRYGLGLSPTTSADRARDFRRNAVGMRSVLESKQKQ